ncbi:unnamed protein product [Schistosoma turkestanicum]|nr:unnamed protein product [Schistosoma turkestanicum]
MSSWNIPNQKVINNLYGHTTWKSMRYISPLHEIEKEWQPNLSKVAAYHNTGAELLQGGWRKWNSSGHPDILAISSASVEPDWYTRRRLDVRNADKKYCEEWAYDRWKRPTSFPVLKVQNLASKENLSVHPVFGKKKTTTKPNLVHTGIKPIHYGIGEGIRSCKLVLEKKN